MENQTLPVKYNESIIKNINTSAKYNNNVLGIVVATKPCFYKLAPLIQEAEKKSLPYIVINSSQHYDNLIGFGVKEFGLDKKTAIDLQLRGDLTQKSSELFLKMREVKEKLKSINPKLNLVPYVNGDTMTAALLPTAWLFATNQKSIQGEAGLRSMSPSSFVKLNKNIAPDKLIESQIDKDWMTNRSEPFPEQYDTYVSAAASEYHFAPVDLNTNYLIKEGYNKKRIFTVGNTVVDAIKMKKDSKPSQSIFDLYPALESGSWIRYDIHRRDNLSKTRFTSIIESVINLVKQGKQICLIELNATKKAIDYYGYRQKLANLSRDNPNFLFTPLWQEYGHVIEFLKSKKCEMIVTDSGSMQEELNELKKPCLTLRFNTDRPETVTEGRSNLLVPPISSRLIADSIKLVSDRNYFGTMSKTKRLYGTDVSKKIVDKINKVFMERSSMFSWAHDELELFKEKEDFNYL